MSRDWEKLTDAYTGNHLSLGLSAPNIRLNALRRIEELLKRKMPEVIDNPTLLLSLEKSTFKKEIEDFKGIELNGAEKSVINGLYNFLHVIGDKPLVNNKGLEQGVKPVDKSRFSSVNESSKTTLYRQLGELLSDLMGMEFECNYSHTIPDLKSTPLPKQFPKTWPYLEDVYNQINGFGLNLTETIERNRNSLKMGRQEADVFLCTPFQGILEYDEKQHFNQFRGQTLQSDMYSNWNGFDLGLYQELCKRVVPPGSKKSGFHFLKSADPLFPENIGTEKQDNRLRQRAFRDMVKDAWSIEMEWKSVLRIPASIARWKRKDLNPNELKSIENYLSGVLIQWK